MGEYQDYLDGKWDGRKHWDEGQVERSGKDVIHNPTVPYMVPTVSFFGISDGAHENCRGHGGGGNPCGRAGILGQKRLFGGFQKRI